MKQALGVSLEQGPQPGMVPPLGASGHAHDAVSVLGICYCHSGVGRCPGVSRVGAGYAATPHSPGLAVKNSLAWSAVWGGSQVCQEQDFTCRAGSQFQELRLTGGCPGSWGHPAPGPVTRQGRQAAGRDDAVGAVLGRGKPQGGTGAY